MRPGSAHIWDMMCCCNTEKWAFLIPEYIMNIYLPVTDDHSLFAPLMFTKTNRPILNMFKLFILISSLLWSPTAFCSELTHSLPHTSRHWAISESSSTTPLSLSTGVSMSPSVRRHRTGEQWMQISRLFHYRELRFFPRSGNYMLCAAAVCFCRVIWNRA